MKDKDCLTNNCVLILCVEICYNTYSTIRKKKKAIDRQSDKWSAAVADVFANLIDGIAKKTKKTEKK